MKQFSRREFLRLASMTTTATLLAACGASQVQPQEAPAEAPQEEAPTAAPAVEKTALLVWDGFQ
jgi:hypothetical protein